MTKPMQAPQTKPPLITLTENAAAHIRELVAKEGSDVIGIRVGLKSAGCSGMKYHVEYASDQKAFEAAITDKGVTVLIDPKAEMFLLGAEMDWQEDVFAAGFVFRNPNEVARCGCGESFSVTARDGFAPATSPMTVPVADPADSTRKGSPS